MRMWRSRWSELGENGYSCRGTICATGDPEPEITDLTDGGRDFTDPEGDPDTDNGALSVARLRDRVRIDTPVALWFWRG